MTDKALIKKAFENLSVSVHEGTDWIKADAHFKIGKGRRATVMLLGSNIELDVAVEKLKSMSDNGWQLTVIYSEAASKLLPIDDVTKAMGAEKVIQLGSCLSMTVENGCANETPQALLAQMDALIIPNLTQNTLAKTAVGIQDDLPSLFMWQALLTGKPVVGCTASVLHGWNDPTKNKIMETLLLQHLKTVASFGATWVTDHSYEEILRHCGLGPEVTSVANSSIAEGLKVVTEQVVKTWKSSTLRVPKGTLVTPSARDLAKTKNIEIIQL